ncbi:nonsense-mediated mRNA decay factor SMG9-like isoform X2 [Halichondria panicea]|uniref:nonsense-mediated mRNA decay factor SMG9-like isoform X2 n=1 Tax=Halichondria panicea TaxID=6063 RepID=UPI00312B3631
MDEERERRHSGSGGRGGRGGKNGRGYRPSRDQRHDRSRSGRGKGDYMGSGGMMKTPIILARSDRRSESSIMPGAISIMQRHPLSPRGGVTSPGGLLPTPPEVPTKQRDDHSKRAPRVRSDGLSSSPSNYTPLQPGSRSRTEVSNSSGVSRSDHFLSGGNEMAHPIKMVDRGLHWEEKGMDFMQDQSDFLVVGVVGKQGVGKSTVMSLLAGTRTGAGKPFMFRTQSKEVWENGGYQTTGVDMVITGERVVLLDTQPVLSESLLEQLSTEEGVVPAGLSPDAYLEVQMSMFLYSVCHVVVVVMDSMEHCDLLTRFLRTIEQMKSVNTDSAEINEKQHYPQLVFVLNHASPDDFQPLSLREMHSILISEFHGSKVNIGGGVSLAKSGLVPIGRGFPDKRLGDKVGPEEVNLHLLPSNPNLADTYGTYSTSHPEKSELNLNPIFHLLTSYDGHPSFNLLSETLRNQVFGMPRPPIRKAAQQLTEKEWFDYARRVWLSLKKSDLISEYDRILQSTTPPG